MTESPELTDAQIKHMVDRFLGWRLPEDFRPDNGISFKPTFNDHLPTPMKCDPVGTNLFTATQAGAMVRHMLEGLPSARPAPPPADAVGVDLDALEKVARELVDEVWAWGLDDIDAVWAATADRAIAGNVVCEPPPQKAKASWGMWPARARHIATFDPPTALKLIALARLSSPRQEDPAQGRALDVEEVADALERELDPLTSSISDPSIETYRAIMLSAARAVIVLINAPEQPVVHAQGRAAVAPTAGDLWWLADDGESGFSSPYDAYEAYADYGGEPEPPVELSRARSLPNVWAVQVVKTRDEDGNPDDAEVVIVNTKAEAIALSNPDSAPTSGEVGGGS